MERTSQNPEIERVTLPAASLDYVKTRLSEGHRFSELLLENVPWSEGRVITYLPKGSPSELYVDPDSGHSGEHPGRMWNFFYSHIAEYLGGADQFVLLLEDRESRVGDRWYQDKDGNKVFFQQYIYWYCMKPETKLIELAIGRAESACTLNGAVCRVPERVHLEPDGTISEEDLTALSQNVSLVIISAYDGCAYVMWERDV